MSTKPSFRNRTWPDVMISSDVILIVTLYGFIILGFFTCVCVYMCLWWDVFACLRAAGERKGGAWSMCAYMYMCVCVCVCVAHFLCSVYIYLALWTCNFSVEGFLCTIYIFIHSLIHCLYFAECNSGKFGNHCAHRCGYCQNGDSCHHETGKCDNGCKAGYHGDGCNLSKLTA